MYSFQQSIWLSPDQHLLQGQPAVIALCSQAEPHTTAQELQGTERKCSSENITLTQTITET